MPALKFTLPEFTGSLADLGTIIPFILIAVSVTGMKLGPILLAFGLFYVVSGLLYRLPVAVEPLKAVGAIAVSSSLTQGEVVGAGIFVGLFFLLIGVTGLIDKIAKVFPLSLIRGVQLGLALVLLVKGGQYLLGDPYLGLIAVGLFVFARIMNSKHSDLNFPGALIVFIIGIAYGFYVHGVPPLQLNVPLDIYVPKLDDLVQGTYKAGIAQLPLTLTNAVLATSLLASDLFKEKISNRKLSVTIGSASVISPLMGGFPMCHGAGGMAAHYQFGARTGGANVMIGILFTLLSFVATSPMLALIPAGILGTLLFFAGVEMLAHAAKTDRMLVTGATGIATVIIDPTIGLVAGIIMFLWSKLFRPGGWPSPWFKQKS